MQNCDAPVVGAAATLRWGKSSALIWLAPRLVTATVPLMFVISRAAWSTLASPRLAACLATLGAHAALAVRSDAASEGGLTGSQTGRFCTELDVVWAELPAAITRVLSAMPGDADDKVLVQAMVSSDALFGVASTHRVTDGAPWYGVEYSSGGSRAVTAGRANGRQRSWPRRRVEADAAHIDDAIAAQALRTLREIERLIPEQPLEIEFAVGDADAPLQLLQVRPLASAACWQTTRLPMRAISPPRFDADRQADVLGQRALYSLMSDWNPAELIGSHPRPLTLDVFNTLIAGGNWWRARAELGYRRPPRRDVGLLKVIAGRPFVDVRRSANSLLPRALPDALATRLVEAWIVRLQQQPELHDKLEFEVICSARDLRSPAAFTAEFAPYLGAQGAREFDSALRQLTLPLMRTDPLVLAPTLSAAAGGGEPALTLTGLLRVARRAAGEFAKLARCAFVAEAQLRSAVMAEALTAERAAELRLSAGSLHGWLADKADPSVVPDQLRPSSFDITQPLWRPARQPAAANSSMRHATPAPFALRPGEVRALARLLRASRLDVDAAAWARWVAQATLAREWGKYRFSQPLARLLEHIAAGGARINVDREALSWLGLTNCRRLLAGKLSSQAVDEHVEHAQRRAAAQSLHLLRPVLRCADDLDSYDSFGMLPNFVGRHSQSGPLRVLENGHPDQLVQAGDVVAVKHADPGYDWLFERGIAGLLTAWGGAHSHMGVRCAEHGVAAALGCGEAVWAQAQRARSARIAPAEAALWLY